MKKFFVKLLIFISIYLILTMITSFLLPDLNDVMEKVMFGIIVIISLSVSELIMKKWNYNNNF
ncbi:hypothetical protein BN1058_01734 [Paraliobacillus sp. PM-2]|nr:hypothetical protein BN1058_01734 [Paraliobacillus sp. PM-2]